MYFIDFHTHKPTAEGVITPRSFAIHPWKANEEKATTYDEFVAIHNDDFANAEIIGECGLDKACDSPWERQNELFRWHIKIAAEQQKPMVIHCVKSFNEIMQLRKMLAAHSAPWVVHGFNGNVQLANQLNRSGIMVSYGAAILDNRRRKVHICLKDNPNPWFLETDDNDCGIEAIYRKAAEILDSDIESLAETIKSRYSALMGSIQ